MIFVLFAGFGVLGGCTNVSDDLSEDEKNLAKSIILREYPNFESEVQQSIKTRNPNYIGPYSYKFQKTEKATVLNVIYGDQNRSAEDLTLVRVDLANNLAVRCGPYDLFLSGDLQTAHKTLCSD